MIAAARNVQVITRIYPDVRLPAHGKHADVRRPPDVAAVPLVDLTNNVARLTPPSSTLPAFRDEHKPGHDGIPAVVKSQLHGRHGADAEHGYHRQRAASANDDDSGSKALMPRSTADDAGSIEQPPLQLHQGCQLLHGKSRF